MNRKEDKLSEVLNYLEKVIEDRKKSKNKSYTADLLSQGIDRVSQKVGEEAIEVVIASNNKKKKQVIYESADLIFHLLVLWKKLGIKNNDTAKECGWMVPFLNKRFAITNEMGLEEDKSNSHDFGNKKNQ